MMNRVQSVCIALLAFVTLLATVSFGWDEPTEPDAPVTEPAVEAADPEAGIETGDSETAPVAEAETDDFPALKKEWATLLTQLREKLIQYRDATQQQRPAIREEYAALVAKGEAMLPKIIAAAENSFQQNPDPQSDPAQFLAEAIRDQVYSRNEYDLAASVGKQLVEAGATNPALAEAIGMASYYQGDLDGTIAMITKAADLHQAAGGESQLKPQSNVLAGQAQQQLEFKAHQQAIVELEEKLADMESPAEQPVREMLDSLRKSVHQLDDFEPAARISQMLIAKGVNDKGLYDVAGVAFFMTNQFDLAEEYLKKAEEAGRISPLGRQSLADLDYYKTLWAEEQEFRKSDAAGEPLPQVVLKTNKGDITLELFENEAPKTVGNFVNLIDKGFYDGIVFHRVLQGFMAQGGDPEGTGGGGPGYTIVDEVRQDEHRKHFRGVLSMAKTQAPDSGGSQFFLTFVPTQQLDGVHTVFGRVIDGLDVLAKLQRIDPGQSGPVPDRIIKAEVLRKRDHEYVPTKSGER